MSALAPGLLQARRLRPRLRQRRQRGREDRGSAVIEFLGVSLLLFVPTVYLVLTLARVEAAAFAAEGAARDVGRVLAAADSMEDGLQAAHHTVEIAFADQGLAVDPAEVLEVSCSTEPCLSPGGYIHVEVAAAVALPVLPDVVAEVTNSQVHIEASAFTGIDRFRDRS